MPTLTSTANHYVMDDTVGKQQNTRLVFDIIKQLTLRKWWMSGLFASPSPLFDAPLEFSQTSFYMYTSAKPRNYIMQRLSPWVFFVHTSLPLITRVFVVFVVDMVSCIWGQ